MMKGMSGEDGLNDGSNEFYSHGYNRFIYFLNEAASGSGVGVGRAGPKIADYSTWRIKWLWPPGWKRAEMTGIMGKNTAG